MRSTFLAFAILLCSFGFAAPKDQQAQPPASIAPFTLRDLGNGAWAATDNPAAKAARSGANAGFVIGSDGVAVIDTFENVAAAQSLLDEIRKKTNLPIRFVVNTHYHLDHVAGNSIFANAGATILAQENVRSWERTENAKFFGPKITAQQKEEVESLGLPSVTYKNGVTLYLDRRALVVRSLPGHTGGDSIVYDSSANVVFCGDLFWNHTLPNLIDASTLPWIETLSTFTKFAAVSPIQSIPGHGDPGNSSDVAAFRDYLSDLREWVLAAIKEGKSGPTVVEAVFPKLKHKYGSWQLFDYFSKRNIADVEAELN